MDCEKMLIKRGNTLNKQHTHTRTRVFACSNLNNIAKEASIISS